jgi:hypothetical protein
MKCHKYYFDFEIHEIIRDNSNISISVLMMDIPHRDIRVHREEELINEITTDICYL